MKTDALKSILSVKLLSLISALSFISVTHAATHRNQTFNNIFERGLSFRGNDKVSRDFQIPESHEQRNFRNSKLFPLFTIIRFTNEICRTTSEETGVCYTRTQCNSLGGLAQGSCASGLGKFNNYRILGIYTDDESSGVCCRFIATCGAIIYQNSTTFQNPNYPSKYTPPGGSDVCQVRIRKQANVCQVRLNFIAFDVEGPATIPATTGGGGGTNVVQNDAGACKIDSLAITSSGAVVPSLCGNMNGQHLYVDFGSSDTITLNLLLGGGSASRERTWNIEILTIPCNSVARAPSGCLQYFTGVSGQVESFNFQGGLHLANLDYSVCVRMEDGMRFIDWIPCGNGMVRIGGTVVAATPPTMNGDCPTPTATTPFPDYLVIPQGISFPPRTTQALPMTSTTDRFCDQTFLVAGSYVRSSAKPFFMHVKTDMSEGTINDASSLGFCFRYQQNPQ